MHMREYSEIQSNLHNVLNQLPTARAAIIWFFKKQELEGLFTLSVFLPSTTHSVPGLYKHMKKAKLH